MAPEFCSVSATSGLCERRLSTRSTPYAEQEVSVPLLGSEREE